MEEKKHLTRAVRYAAADIAKSILLLIAASGIGYMFELLGFAEANIITVYVLAVLIISVVTVNRIYSLIASVVSVLICSKKRRTHTVSIFLFVSLLSLRKYFTSLQIF